MDGLIGSEEAARRLGVKLSTLYVYVSRGLLTSHRAANRRRSLFDLEEVELLADRTRGSRKVDSRIATIATSVTRLAPSGPIYRGTPAVSLIGQSRFEDVAEMLWRVPAGSWDAHRNVAGVGIAELPLEEQLRCMVVIAGSQDVLKTDPRPTAVANAARSLIASIVHGLSVNAGVRCNSELPIAHQLTAALIPERTAPATVAAVEAIMILMADHELPLPTVAVRLAASARTDVYNAVLAGLGVASGPLHSKELAFRLLGECQRIGAYKAVGEFLGWHGQLRGFGSRSYAAGDPRFAALREKFESIASEEQRLVLSSLIATIAEAELPSPNVDLGVAAILWALDSTPNVASAISTIARIAGWIAHYLEELDEQPMRFRSRAVYVNSPNEEDLSARSRPPGLTSAAPRDLGQA